MRTEAERIFLEDVRDKKNISHSASHKRTHCGKGGRVRLPSDKLTKKELEKMNGECEVYRLNEPMKWAEFIVMPREYQITYIKKLREKFNVPDMHIGKMFGVDQNTISRYTRKLGIPSSYGRGSARWDKDGWYLFTHGVKLSEIGAQTDPDVAQITHFDPIAEENAPAERQTAVLDDFAHLEAAECCETVKEDLAPVPFEENEPVPAFEECHVDKPLIPITPCSGTMSFEGKFEDVLKALSIMIGSGSGKIHIAWDVA